MNKRKYYLSMLGLATSLSLMGCNKYNLYGNQMTKDDIKNYIGSIDNKSNIETLSYEVVANMKTVTIRTKDDYTTYLAINPYGNLNACYDYFTGAKLNSYIPQEYYVNDMIYWLQEYNYVRENYTEDELKEFIEEVNKSYNVDKVLCLKKGE